MMQRLLLLVCLTVSVAAPSLAAQSPCGGWVKVVTDSLVEETIRRSAAGKLLAPRAPTIRRFAARIDSIEAACPKVLADTSAAPSPVASVGLSFDYRTTVAWPTGALGVVPEGGALLCAVVDVGGTTYLADRAVTANRVAPDSIDWAPAVFPSSNALRAACAPTLPGYNVAALKVWKTFWSSARVHTDPGIAVPVAQGQRP